MRAGRVLLVALAAFMSIYILLHLVLLPFDISAAQQISQARSCSLPGDSSGNCLRPVAATVSRIVFTDVWLPRGGMLGDAVLYLAGRARIPHSVTLAFSNQPPERLQGHAVTLYEWQGAYVRVDTPYGRYYTVDYPPEAVTADLLVDGFGLLVLGVPGAAYLWYRVSESRDRRKMYRTESQMNERTM